MFLLSAARDASASRASLSAPVSEAPEKGGIFENFLELFLLQRLGKAEIEEEEGEDPERPRPHPLAALPHFVESVRPAAPASPQDGEAVSLVIPLSGEIKQEGQSKQPEHSPEEKREAREARTENAAVLLVTASLSGTVQPVLERIEVRSGEKQEFEAVSGPERKIPLAAAEATLAPADPGEPEDRGKELIPRPDRAEVTEMFPGIRRRITAFERDLPKRLKAERNPELRTLEFTVPGRDFKPISEKIVLHLPNDAAEMQEGKGELPVLDLGPLRPQANPKDPQPPRDSRSASDFPKREALTEAAPEKEEITSPAKDHNVSGDQAPLQAKKEMQPVKIPLPPKREEKTVRPKEEIPLEAGREFKQPGKIPTAPRQAPAEPTPAVLNLRESYNLLNRLTRQIHSLVQEERSEVRIQLKPEHLGEMKIKLSFERGQIMAEFVVESETVRQVIAANLPQLHTALQQQGAQVAEMMVNIGFGQGERGQDSRSPFRQLHTGRGQNRDGGAISEKNGLLDKSIWHQVDLKA